MAKSSKQSNATSQSKRWSWSDVGSTIAQGFSSIAWGALKEGAENVVKSVETKALVIEEKMLLRVQRAVLSLAAIIFLLVACFFYLTDLLGLARAHALLLSSIFLFGIVGYLRYREFCLEHPRK